MSLPKIQIAKKYAIKKELLNRRAKCSLAAFILYMRPKYKTSKFFYSICGAIDEFLNDLIVMRKLVNELSPKEVDELYDQGKIKIPKLILQAPPRHGKTDIVSRYLPAYFFGRYPDMNVIALSGGDDLATSNNRDVQAIMLSDKYVDLFGNLLNVNRVVTKDGESRRNMDMFEVTKDGNILGSYNCSTVNGNIMGKGCNLLILDDPIKNDEMANSPTQKDKLEDWYFNTAVSRCEIPYGLIVMHQRWAVDDLAGRILDKYPTEWRNLKFKAIQDDGTALIPNHIPLFKLLDMKNSASNFSAMYQQEPVLKGGNLIKTDNFKYFNPLDPPQDMIICDMSYIICDTAIGQKESNDYTVMGYFRKSGKNLYLVDLIKGKWTMLQQLEHMKNFRIKHQENVLKIEKVGAHVSNGVFELLAKEGIPAIPITPKGRDKVARVRQATPYIDRGQVYLPKGVPWLSDFLIECEQFTTTNSHPHDDQVDVLSYGIEEAFPIISSTDPMTMSFNYKKI